MGDHQQAYNDHERTIGAQSHWARDRGRYAKSAGEVRTFVRARSQGKETSKTIDYVGDLLACLAIRIFRFHRNPIRDPRSHNGLPAPSAILYYPISDYCWRVVTNREINRPTCPSSADPDIQHLLASLHSPLRRFPHAMALWIAVSPPIPPGQRSIFNRRHRWHHRPVSATDLLVPQLVGS